MPSSERFRGLSIPKSSYIAISEILRMWGWRLNSVPAGRFPAPAWQSQPAARPLPPRSARTAAFGLRTMTNCGNPPPRRRRARSGAGTEHGIPAARRPPRTPTPGATVCLFRPPTRSAQHRRSRSASPSRAASWTGGARPCPPAGAADGDAPYTADAFALARGRRSEERQDLGARRLRRSERGGRSVACDQGFEGEHRRQCAWLAERLPGGSSPSEGLRKALLALAVVVAARAVSGVPSSV